MPVAASGAPLEASYRHCRQVVLNAKSNLGRAFWLLSGEQRRGMDALYAFARAADDLVDRQVSAEIRRADLTQFRVDLERALAGSPGGSLFPALIDTIERFQISPKHCFDLLSGCEMDLEQNRYANWGELRQYCLRVASSVGLACLPIWGCRDPQALEPAVDCGLALQLTNILRDVRADWQLGRVYLPQDELSSRGLSAESLFAGEPPPQAVELVNSLVARAESLYQSARRGLPYVPQPARRLYWLMEATYYQLLRKIAADPLQIFRQRIQLSRFHKILLASRAATGLI
jgi:phytoene synthase